MSYKPLSQTVTNGKDKEVSSSDAVFDHIASEISAIPASASLTLNNLTAPTAVNQDLIFNKASAAILQGSDAKATQANHDLTIRAGNTGAAVSGGHLTFNSGTSTGGNGGSIYLNTTGGTRTSSRGIYFSTTETANAFEVSSDEVIFRLNLKSGTDNTLFIGRSGSNGVLESRPHTVAVGTAVVVGLQGATGTVMGWENHANKNLGACGSLLIRGGDGLNENVVMGNNPAGDLTARGGNHAGNTGTSATQRAGNLTLRGGNKTGGTGNGGNVSIAGGTSVGGTAGNVSITTAAVERINIKDATEIVVNDTGVNFDFRVEGDTDANLLFVDASTDRVGIGTATPTEKLEVNGNIKGGTISFNADANRQATLTNLGFLTATKTHDFGSIAHGDEEETTITVTGAAVGDAVFVGAPSAIEANLNWCAYVSAADTVTLRLQNVDSSGSIDPASATWRVTVLKT